MDHAHSERATVALRKLQEIDPAFASLSLWARHRDAKPIEFDGVLVDEAGATTRVQKRFDLAPAYTDGRTVFYGEKFAGWTLNEQVGVCAHEISHIAWGHIPRAKKLRDRFPASFDADLLNIATDAIINEMLLLAGFSLPEQRIVLTELLDKVFGEKVTAADALAEYDAEKLYVRLQSAKSPTGKGGAGKAAAKSGGTGSDPSKGQGGRDEDSEGADGKGKGGKKSPADKAKEYAEGKDFGGDMDMSGPHTTRDEQEANEWRDRLAHALAQGQKAGKGIGKLGHMLADIPRSRTPWELVLRRLVTKAVTRKPRVSMSRPTRRWLGIEADARARGLDMPAYEPGYIMDNGIPRIVVGVDVSGSIDDEILAMFAGEIAGIGNRTGAEIHLIVFDDGVISEEKLQGVNFVSELRKIDFARGGGTSFVEVVDRAVELDPSIIVVLTDLYGPFGKAPKSVPVVWATPEGSAESAPFGRVLKLDS